MYRYFGSIPPGAEIKEGDWEIEFKCYLDNCVYKRKRRRKLAKYVVGDVKTLYALPMIYTGKSYFMNLALDTPITLDDEAYVEFRVGLPIAVKIVSEKEVIITYEKELVERSVVKTVVDQIALTLVKYSIYGDVMRGLLTRFYPVKVGSWSFITEIPLTLRIYNNSRQAYTLKRIVFPSTLPELYFKEGSPHAVASPLRITLEKKYAVVERDDTEAPEGFVKAEGSGVVKKWVAIFGLS